MSSFSVGPIHLTCLLVAGAMVFRPASILWRIECCLFEPVRFSLTLYSILEGTTGGERRGEGTGPLGVFSNLPCFSSLEPKGEGVSPGTSIPPRTWDFCAFYVSFSGSIHVRK